MKKKLYKKPSSYVIRLNIKDQLLDNKMGNTSPGAHVGESYDGDGQGSKEFTPDGWEDDSNSFNPWEN